MEDLTCYYCQYFILHYVRFYTEYFEANCGKCIVTEEIVDKNKIKCKKFKMREGWHRVNLNF